MIKKIYLIEDILDNKYVGSTKQTLNERLSKHRCDKKNNNKSCSSKKLNLDYSIIYTLEECSEDLRKEREKYWINEFDTVNINKLNFDQKDYNKNNKEKLKVHYKKYYEKNKDHRIEKNKEWCKNNKEKRDEYINEYNLFRSTKVTNGCYEFIKMLEEY